MLLTKVLAMFAESKGCWERCRQLIMTGMKWRRAGPEIRPLNLSLNSSPDVKRLGLPAIDQYD